MGSIYRRGKTYWIKYYRSGKPYYESSGSDKKMVADRLLKKREGAISEGKAPGIHFEKVTFDELAEDFLTDYRINNKKSLDGAERSVRHLRRWFEGARAVNISTASIKSYIQARIDEGFENSTVNRELAALKRMFNLGASCTPPKVDRVPYIPMLRENNTRKGFFEHGDFLALREALPDYMKGLVTLAYKTGWRKSEVAGLQWSQVDLNKGIVRLNPGETKNDEGRTVYLDEELREIFQRQWTARSRNRKLTPYVFPNRAGEGKIVDFRDVWDRACQEAGIGKRLFHDFRRTAVRNMVRAGIPERVAMMISGHKTRSVFERYNIVSEEDLRLAASRQETYLNGQNGYKTVTIADFPQKKSGSKAANSLI